MQRLHITGYRAHLDVLRRPLISGRFLQNHPKTECLFEADDTHLPSPLPDGWALVADATAWDTIEAQFVAAQPQPPQLTADEKAIDAILAKPEADITPADLARIVHWLGQRARGPRA